MTIRQILTTRRIAALALLGAIPLALIGSVPGSADAAAESTPEEAALPVKTERARMTDGYERRHHFTGRIVARRNADLGFERLGRIVRLAVDDGALVEQGAVLAELDQRELQLTRTRVLAQRDQARARLDELEAGPRRQAIDAAGQQVEDLKAQLALSKRKLARADRLVARGTIGAEAHDEVAYATQALGARLAAAQQRLAELVEGTRKERIAAQRALVTQLDAQVGSIDLQIEKSTLRAPFRGRIDARLADEGHVVAAREVVFRLVESGVLEARVGLPARTAATMQAGSRRIVTVDGRAYEGNVRATLPALDRTSRTRTVVLDLNDGAGESVVPGQIARLEIVQRVEALGFWLPNTALVKSTRGLWSVLVAHEGRVERRDVELVHTQSDRVLVRGTLRENEKVIVAGTHRVVAGQRVEG
ncbi:MAG: efflux RND transporter periplasmic adaptor subunit [Planctomycetota bacterium]|jgi:multidrug efflux pump subunit AcrA (membrane-fusion protein)